MDYPDNFETPAFPAGKRIAVSRLMAIWTLIASLLVVFLCGILLWSARSSRLVPFLISANNDSGGWSVLGKSSNVLEYSPHQTIQESIVVKFIQDWFKISFNNDENTAAWHMCNRTDCSGTNLVINDFPSCVIYCAVGDAVYSHFSGYILPDYVARAEHGEVWQVDKESIVVTPVGKISDMTGSWEARANIYSNVNGGFTVRAFVKIARNQNHYLQNMGFYIADFNAYRMN